MNLAEFQVDHLHSLAGNTTDRNIAGRVSFKDVGGPAEVKLGYWGFGDTGPIEGDATEIDSFDPSSYFVHNPQVFLLRDADVRTQYGIVTVSDVAVRESLFHFPWHRFADFARVRSERLDIRCKIIAHNPEFELSDAISAQAGIHENYYHWLVLFLCRVNSRFLEAWEGELASKPVMVVPTFANDVQRESATAIAEHFRLPLLSVAHNGVLRVRRLIFPLPMRTGGLRAHPVIGETFEILRRRFFRAGDYPDKIYISRQDTQHRRMVNEEEVETLLAARGYAIVRLEGWSFREQVNLFAHARKIIAPHGAGLTNIGFCEPGSHVLEILMPSYLNWCYRRMACALGLKYGFLYGQLETDTKRHINARQFSVDLKKLQACIDSGF